MFGHIFATTLRQIDRPRNKRKRNVSSNCLSKLLPDVRSLELQRKIGSRLTGRKLNAAQGQHCTCIIYEATIFHLE